MLKTLAIYGILCATLIAQDTEESEATTTSGNVLPALKVLPAGSILRGVKIPRYNPDYTPASLLIAKQLKIISQRQIQGTSVDLKLYNPNGDIKASTHLKSLDYDQATELITSHENFLFSATQFQTTSQGLILDWKNNRGFFLGKNHTIVYLKESAPMKDKKNTSNALPTKALTALVAATMASTPNALSDTTPEEIAEIDRLSQPSTAAIQKINTQVQQQIQTAEKTTTEIDRSKAALTNTVQNSDPNLLKAAKTNNTPFQIPADLKPQKGKDHFSIKSEGNVFFDAKKGMMVFNKNVKVTHPEYQFSCAGEVKLLMAQKKLDKKLTEKQLAELKPNERFGDISRIIATDNVIIVGKDKDGNPVAARAGSLVYEHSSGVILLRGLNSRITMPDKQLKIVEKDGYIKIDQNWNISGKGTQIDLNIEKLKNNAG